MENKINKTNSHLNLWHIYSSKYVSTWLIVTIVMVVMMIIIGGITRLTDSGLSITNWDLFSGIIPPLNNSEWSNFFYLYQKYMYQCLTIY